MSSLSCPFCGAVLSKRDRTAESCPECAMPIGDELRASLRDATRTAAPEVTDSPAIAPPPEAPPEAPKEPPKRRPTVASTPLDETGTPPAAIDESANPWEGWADVYSTLIGRTIGGCRILSLIGQGAMGAVFEAEQLNLDRKVALKTIKPEFSNNEDLLNRFRQEARTVGKFTTPYVIRIFDVGFENGLNYITMEYAAGGSIQDFCKEQPGGKLDVTQAVRFLSQICDAMLEAEKLGVVHRDIKPENLLLDNNERIKVADFGIAKNIHATVQLTTTTALIGTPLYMSPEQCTGADVDHRSDMYSLGATFFHLLTGTPPFDDGNPYTVLKKKLDTQCFSPNAIEGFDQIPGALNDIIERMTALEPGDRYESFEDLLEDLRGTRGSGGHRVHRARGKRAFGKWAAALVLVGACGGGGAWAWKPYIKPWLFPKPAPEPIPTPTPEPTTPTLDHAAAQKKIGELRAALSQTFDPAGEPPDGGQLTPVRDGAKAMRTWIGSFVAEDEEARAIDLELQHVDADLDRYLAFRATERPSEEPGYDLPFDELIKYCKAIAEDATPSAYESAALKAYFEQTWEPQANAIRTETEKVVKVAHDSIVGRLAKRNEAKDQKLVANWIQTDVNGLKNAKAKLATGLTGIDVLSELHEVIDDSELDRLSNRTRDALEEERTLSIAKLEVHNKSSEIDWTLPYTNLVEKLRAIDTALKPKNENNTPWLTMGLDKLRNEIVVKAAGEFGNAVDQVAATDAALENLVAGRRNLLAAFPDERARFSGILTAERERSLRDKLDREKNLAAEIATLTETTTELEDKFTASLNLETWKRQTAKVVADALTPLRVEFTTLSGRPDASGSPSVRDLEQRIAKLNADMKRWNAATRAFALATASLHQNHDLRTARERIDAIRKDGIEDPVLARVLRAISLLETGFDHVLGDLRLEEAKTAFEQAASEFKSTTVPDRYPRQCLERTKELEALVSSDMAPVPRGEAKRPDPRQVEEVGAFFVDEREVSFDEYKAFQHANTTFDEKLWGGHERYEPDLNVKELFRRYKNNRYFAEPMPGYYPAERVNYYQAMAYLRKHKKDLPTVEEWFLAARGPYLTRRGGHRTYTYDGETRLPDAGAAKIHYGKRQPTSVHEGGLVGGYDPKYKVRHLAGNVAEWTKLEKQADGRWKGQVMGGSYLTNREGAYTGEKEDWRVPRKTDPGIGFRGVVRVTEFFRDLTPRKD